MPVTRAARTHKLEIANDRRSRGLGAQLAAPSSLLRLGLVLNVVPGVARHRFDAAAAVVAARSGADWHAGRSGLGCPVGLPEWRSDPHFVPVRVG